MSLTNLSIAELQDLLMEETKKFTLLMRGEDTGEDRDKIRYKIEKIQRILEEKMERNDTPNAIVG
jgi:hypothetical protein